MGHLELHGVSKSFGGVRALADLSLDVAAGELVSLLGPSGCGKTTALRIVGGFEFADTGRVMIGGHEVTDLPPTRRDIGMVFQAYSLFPNMTAAQNVEFGMRLRRQPTTRRRDQTAELLALVGLSAHADKYPHQLSGGQQQRVALARALAIRPKMLLLDEPLSALDAKVRVGLREEIRRIQQELGITTLFVTHDQEEALAISDRVGVMSEGRLEQLDVPAKVYREPATPFVAQFVGVANTLRCRIDGGAAVMRDYRLPLDESVAGQDGSEARLVVRPEEIRLAAADADHPGGGLRGTVLTQSFLGPVTRVTVRLSGEEAESLHVDLPSYEASAYPVGGEVTVLLEPRRPMLVPVG